MQCALSSHSELLSSPLLSHTVLLFDCQCVQQVGQAGGLLQHTMRQADPTTPVLGGRLLGSALWDAAHACAERPALLH